MQTIMADELIAGLREALGPFLSVSSLTDLYHAYKSIPTFYALVGHCLFCATLAPEFKHRFLLHFWVRDESSPFFLEETAAMSRTKQTIAMAARGYLVCCNESGPAHVQAGEDHSACGSPTVD